MDQLTAPREKTLGLITLLVGLIFWAALLAGTFGAAFGFMLIGFLVYLFSHSAFISRVRGEGVEISENQFVDIHNALLECCQKLGIQKIPNAYILNGNGTLNAFATKFLRTEYVILLSDIVDAMRSNPEGLKFYLGHELGHLKKKHLRGALLRAPALWIPLLGAAYSRARETTCDRHGSACCSTPDAAASALIALAAGGQRCKEVDLNSYATQVRHASGYWMSFHELIGGYPWLSKRVLRVLKRDTQIPRRSAFAYLPAIFVPYAGRLGGGFGALMLVYIIAILAAVAIPAYQEYTVKAKLSAAIDGSQRARDTLAGYYQARRQVPSSLDVAGVENQLSDGNRLELDAERMILTIITSNGRIVFVPKLDSQGRVIWSCTNGDGLKPTQLPPNCK